jgi:cell division control protein 6
MNNHCIVVNREALTENYLPERMVGRESEVEKVTRCLSPATKRRKPLHIWISGDSGTGKTVLARFILSEMMREHPSIHGAYIDCWKHDTLYKVAAALVHSLRILGAEQQDTVLKLDRLERYLQGRPLIVILDQIDQTFPKDRNSIILGLCNMESTGLVCIARKKNAFFSLQCTARSRLNPQFVECKRYSAEDLIGILRDRAQIALIEDSCHVSVCKKIAHLSKGDARVAIQTLRSAVEWAEEERSSRIRGQDVARVWNDINQPPKEYVLASLTEDHRMLYDIVREHGQIVSGELRKLYLRRCESTDRKPIAVRTFSDYANRLLQYGLVSSERARVRGRVRLFKIMA